MPSKLPFFAQTSVPEASKPAEPSGAEASSPELPPELERWGFADLPELVAPLSESAESPWRFIAYGLSFLVLASVLWAAWKLRQNRPQILSPLELAQQKLSQLEQQSPRSQETARKCSQILCQAWASHYRENLLAQSPLLILQKYALLRRLPQPLQEPLLLFLAQCVDAAYRPEADKLPSTELLAQARKLLKASKRYPLK